MPQNLTKHLRVRLSASTARAFEKKCQSYGTPSVVVRELVNAFIEDRLTIAAPTTTRKSLYVTRNQD